jgi:hypothetical protein
MEAGMVNLDHQLLNNAQRLITGHNVHRNVGTASSD